MHIRSGVTYARIATPLELVLTIHDTIPLLATHIGLSVRSLKQLLWLQLT